MKDIKQRPFEVQSLDGGSVLVERGTGRAITSSLDSNKSESFTPYTLPSYSLGKFATKTVLLTPTEKQAVDEEVQRLSRAKNDRGRNLGKKDQAELLSQFIEKKISERGDAAPSASERAAPPQAASRSAQSSEIKTIGDWMEANARTPRIKKADGGTYPRPDADALEAILEMRGNPTAITAFETTFGPGAYEIYLSPLRN
jgi:hypothetical protein